jgi:hypothetical protein
MVLLISSRSQCVMLYTVLMVPHVPQDIKKLHNELFMPFLFACIVKTGALVICMFGCWASFL